MNLLDTFSGIGGWALASRWMGWQTLAFVEKDKFCHKVLSKNFPDIPIHDDIFTFSGKPFRGRVDILTGSTPCQPFSQAGKRQGSNDERHLFPEFLRVVAEVRPRWIVIENVFGLLNIESGRVFEAYCTSLESEGYSVQTLCIPASALNAPHRRDRLWIVANDTNADKWQSRSGDVAKSVRAAHTEFGSDGSNAPHTLNGEHRTDANNAGSRTSRSEPDAKRAPLGGERQQSQSEPCGHAADAVNTASKRLERGIRTGMQGREPRPAISDWQREWTDVAARTCVRRVDDGIPDELHITGSRDNRVNRLKALGNAIVPAIAYEIFRAIYRLSDCETSKRRKSRSEM